MVSPMARIPKVVLLIESSRASGRAVLKGIANYARYHGPWSFFWEPAGLEKAGPMLKALGADGIILRDVDKLSEVRSFGIPAVVVGYSREEIPGLINVVTDSVRIGRMAAEHLLQCGFKRFASCSYDKTPWAEQRAKSFAETIRAAGHEVHAYLAPTPARVNWLRERRRMATWLGSLPKPVGVMACNDDCGVQVMEACKVASLSVPDAVGVIGADDDELVCDLADPAMSSVALNFERAGFESAQALDKLMHRRNGAPSQIIVQATHIVARRSTDVVAVNDEPVAKAMRFIRDHARESLAVDEVARAAGLSRRVLERRFRRELNSSILAEIRRVRTDQIGRLLVETHLPVSDIAESLGFADPQHFARYFRSGKQLTPLAYRKRFGAKSTPGA
jgi:LacI family transcriptional regulator